MTILRHATAGDERFIVEMARHAGTIEERPLPGAQEAVVRDVLPPGPDAVLVATDEGGRRLGAAWWHWHEPPLLTDAGGRAVPEMIVAVEEDARGHGVGGELVEALARRAGERFDALGLNVHLRNPAVRLYTRMGFSVAGRGRGRFGVAMRRPLRTGGVPADGEEAELVLRDGDAIVSFSFADLLRYHGGGGSPGGVAHAFKVLERGLPLLGDGSPVDRRAIHIATAFGGPGARDGFELVTRAVGDRRFVVDATLARPELGRARERFVFRLSLGEREALLVLRDGFVSDAFIDLTRHPDRSEAQERRLTEMKAEMAARVMAARPEDVYDVAEP